ncbi:class I SAM-dependent methyltransferase [Dactylosporangium sp. CA-139066]|uniref:class I SAM-dependent methyltransferase n=1 Tax=Dactylosporangium sp. CA-139066 TaxID=3239930 RepID=UPI003D8DE9A2
MNDFDASIADALAAPTGGWDFSFLDGRTHCAETSWSYTDLARPLIDAAGALLDVDTGGGELLAAFAPLPARTVAVESHQPAVAAARLGALGVAVVPALADAGGGFDLVLNRHGRLDAAGTARALRRGGTLLSQQVGAEDCAELNAALGAPPPRPAGAWSAAVAAEALAAAGFALQEVREEFPELTFDDPGAIVFQLRMVAWQIPDFSIERHGARLRALRYPFTVRTHRFLIRASNG